MQTCRYSQFTLSVTGSLVIIGQAGSVPPPPHTPGAVTFTVQVYEPADETVAEVIMAVSVWVVPETAGIALLTIP